MSGGLGRAGIDETVFGFVQSHGEIREMAAIRQIVRALLWTAVFVCLPCVAQTAQVIGESQTGNQNQNASISGTVQSEAGALENAHVSAFQVVTFNGWARLAEKCDVETDSRGRYQCLGLAAGKYYVLASGGMLPGKKNKPEKKANPYAFFPSASDLEDAGEIVVGASQLQSADIFLASGDLHTVTYKVGVVARYAQARLLARTNSRDGRLVADTGIRGLYSKKGEEVRFEGVPAGSFDALVLWRAGRELHVSEAEVSVQSADVAGISLEDQFPVSVEGTVTVDSGSSGAKVAMSVVTLERASDTDFAFEPQLFSAQIGADGSFRFASVMPGRYFFKVVSDPQVFVESSTIGGLSKNGSAVVIASGPENLTVQVEASAEVGSIGGVVNDLPEGSSKAVVVVQAEDTGQVFTASTDQSGKFTVTGLGPGEYRIFSWPDLSHVAYRDPSVLREFADSSAEVLLQSGAMNQSANVSLIQNQ